MFLGRRNTAFVAMIQSIRLFTTRQISVRKLYMYLSSLFSVPQTFGNMYFPSLAPDFRSERKRRARNPTLIRCRLALVADYRFYQEMGQQDLRKTINYMVTESVLIISDNKKA